MTNTITLNEGAAMEITAGSYYRTRSGAKAFIAGRNPFADNDTQMWAGFVEGIGIRAWLEDGRNEWDRDSDLIAPWTEPRTLEVGVALVAVRQTDKYSSSKIGMTHEEAKRIYGDRLLGFRKTTMTEGEFDA